MEKEEKEFEIQEEKKEKEEKEFEIQEQEEKDIHYEHVVKDTELSIAPPNLFWKWKIFM